MNIKTLCLVVCIMFAGISVKSQTWLTSSPSWLSPDSTSTIVNAVNLIDGDSVNTYGYLAMSQYNILYEKTLFIDFGQPKSINGFSFRYSVPNTENNNCYGGYPGSIAHTFKGRLFYLNASNQWVETYTAPELRHMGTACQIEDTAMYFFSSHSARKWKFLMAGCYWLGGSYQTTTYFRTYEIYFREISTPAIQATNVSFLNKTTTQLSFNWTDGNGEKRAVFIKQDSTGTAVPTDSLSYNANTTFGSGTQIGTSGWYCVFNGTTHSSGVSVSGLSPNIKYRVMVCEYNGTAGAERYNVTAATSNPNNQRTCANGSSIPTDGLIAWFPFNGNANDLTGNGNNGIVTGATLTTDRFGNSNSAYFFDGVNDYIKIITNSLLDIKNSITISAWAKHTSYDLTTYQSQIFWRGDGQSAHDPYSLCFTGGSIGFRRDVNTGGTTNQITYPASAIDTNVYHHLVGMYDSISNLMSLYIDGVLVNQQVMPGDINYATSSFWDMIGAVDNGGWQWFKGKIDDIRIYNRNLSDCEVQGLFQETSPSPVQATELTFSNISGDQFTFNWTDGNASKRAVFMKQDSLGTATPVNNTTYTANTTFGSGTQIGSSGWYCVFNGTSHASGVTVSGLQPGIKYRLMVCEYNGDGGFENYNISTATNNPLNQLTGYIFSEININFTGVHGGDVQWGDYDGDGDIDALVSGYQSIIPSGRDNGSVKIYRNDGNDIFTDINASFPIPGFITGHAAMGDIDNDGKMEVAVIYRENISEISQHRTKIYKQLITNEWVDIGETLLGGSNATLAWGDYNNDGFIDLFVQGDASYAAYFAKVYKNNGNYTFTDINAGMQGAMNHNSAGWGDYNNDTYIDLFYVGFSYGITYAELYKNNGNNSFSNIPNTIQPGLSAWIDYNNDGFLDIVSALNENLHVMYKNNGDGTFSVTTLTFPVSGSLGGSGAVIAGDYNNDGNQDVFFTGTNYYYTSLYKNNSGLSFSLITNTGIIPLSESDAAFGDYNGDGLLDLIIQGWNGTINVTKIYKNCLAFNFQASNLTFSNTSPNQVNINWTDGNGSNRAVFMKQDTTGTAMPLNDTTYTPGSAFGSGTQIGTSGWYCVFNGAAHSSGVTVTNLLPNTNYRVMVCEYNGAAGSEQYNTSAASNNPKNRQTIPANVAPVTIAGVLGAGAGYPVSVPITVLSFDSITAISLRLDYDPTVMTFSSGANINAALAGMLVNDVYVSAALHKVMIAWSDTLPVTLADSSKLLDLVFTFISDTTAVTFNNVSNGGGDCEYADANGNPLIDVPTDTYYINGEVHAGLNISGTFRYNNSDSTALDSLWVILNQNGVKVDSVQTDVNGHYTFLGKASNTYTIGASCQKPWGGVNSTDATKIQLHYAGLELFIIPVRLLAADVNNSGFINSTDAIKVMRRYSGLDSTFARGDWTFAKPTGGDTVMLQAINVVQYFQGLCVGDVNGSHLPSPGDAAQQSVTLLTEGTMEVIQGREFELPVRILSKCQVSGISLVFSYPQEYLELAGIGIADGNVIYTARNGQIRIAWSQLESLNLSQGEELITLKFRLSESAPLGMPLSLTLENESELADGWGEPLINSMISVLSVLPVKPYGIHEGSSLISDVLLYPNPATNKAWIEFNLLSDANILVECYNIVGELIKTIRFDELSQGRHRREVNASGFANGIYTLKIKVNGVTESMVYYKLVISK